MNVQPVSNVPIVIGGSHRSGTTLLRRLLNGHSRIYCPAEIKFFKDLLQQFPNDPLRHARLTASMAALELPENVWLDEFGRALVRCYERAAAQKGKVRWADKSPENALNVEHWDRLLGGNFHFVLVLRNPLDIVASMEETPMPLAIPTSPAGRARHIMEYVGAGLAFCDRHPDRSSILRYEDLVSSPVETMEVLLSRLGERFEPQMLDDPSAPTHGSGLEDPKVKRQKIISTDGIGRWRQDIPAEQRDVLLDEFDRFLGRLGYHPD